ncbi:MAG: hypothetical protein KA153_01820 [Hyphomonadaceae bacterium]|nr:hypothetical protein [Caulobacteraceae bacterium]MBP6688702.1 hypothetical protein [Hyphomonadaceae bacterium]
MKTWATKLALLVAASFLTMAGTAQAEVRLSFSTGVDYSSGEYGGEETTEVIAVPFGVRLTVDDWTFRASTSYLDITGPADVSEDGETGEGSGVVVREGAERGLGDTRLSVERAFRRIGGTDAYVEVSAQVRLPTGDEERGLGVGTTDYAVVSEVGVSGDGGGIYVSAGYRFLGQRDGGPEREDGMQAGVGAWLPAGNRMRVGAFGNWRQASTEGNDDPANAGAYISYRMSERMRVTFTASGGLSDASPDYMAGIRFNWLPGGLNN